MVTSQQASNVVGRGAWVWSPKQHSKPVAPGHVAVQKSQQGPQRLGTSPTVFLGREGERGRDFLLAYVLTSLHIPVLDYTSTEDAKNPNLFTKY